MSVSEQFLSGRNPEAQRRWIYGFGVLVVTGLPGAPLHAIATKLAQRHTLPLLEVGNDNPYPVHEKHILSATRENPVILTGELTNLFLDTDQQLSLEKFPMTDPFYVFVGVPPEVMQRTLRTARGEYASREIFERDFEQRMQAIQTILKKLKSSSLTRIDLQTAETASSTTTAVLIDTTLRARNMIKPIVAEPVRKPLITATRNRKPQEGKGFIFPTL